MKQNISFSVVIPNYNGADLLAKNIPFVEQAVLYFREEISRRSDLKQILSFNSSEIIVVDDCSTDDSLDILRTSFPGVTVATHSENKGYSDAVYTGILRAKNEIIILLNSDVAPNKNALLPLLSHFVHQDVFATSPLILDESGAPIKVSLNLPLLRRGKLELSEWRRPRASGPADNLCTRFHLFGSGGSVALRREVFLKLGGFTPLFRPFYYEDMELGIKAWRAGWKILFEPKSVVVHPQGSTIRKHNSRTKIKAVMQRNRLMMHWIHLPIADLVTAHCPYLVLRYVEHTLKINFIAWKGLFMAIVKIPDVFAERKNIKKAYTKSLRAVIDAIKREPIASPMDCLDPPGGLDSD
ncbi:MAG TPA: glycosyltransferase [Spongiibacteraceae bacterium]|nr:glycosyltransferase [Spongiibacteraceae bacterium]